MTRLSPPAPPQVAVVTDSTSAYARGILSGVAAYAQLNGPWDFLQQFYHRQASDPALIRELAQWRGDGVIVHVRTRGMAEMLEAKGAPTVNVSGLLDAVDLPLVTADNAAVGRLAATHFADRGFRRLGFLGHDRLAYSRLRREAFEREAAARGVTCDVLGYRLAPKVVKPLADARSWAVWLHAVLKPVGVLAMNDQLARRLLHLCHAEGLAVPDDVAILGCDDDELIWGFVHPPLSSIDIGSERIGHAAAELLDRMMQGEPAPDAPILIPPRGVATRQSTDLFAVDDPLVAKALRHIQRHATDPIDVDAVADAVATGRRTLELRFAQAIHLSPFAAIRRVQIDRAKALLTRTELPMPEVARRSGLTDGRQLSTVFRQATGTTPTHFRKNARRETTP